MRTRCPPVRLRLPHSGLFAFNSLRYVPRCAVLIRVHRNPTLNTERQLPIVRRRTDQCQWRNPAGQDHAWTKERTPRFSLNVIFPERCLADPWSRSSSGHCRLFRALALKAEARLSPSAPVITQNRLFVHRRNRLSAPRNPPLDCELKGTTRARPRDRLPMMQADLRRKTEFCEFFLSVKVQP